MNEMTFWLPSLTTGGLVAAVLWLARNLIITRLTRSVQSEFDSKLEELRAELNGKQAQIDSLRSGAMSGLLARQGKLYERQILAIDQLWESVIELEKAKVISSYVAVFKFDECASEAAKSEKFRQIFDVVGRGFDLENVNLSEAQKARPFLTPLAWAYYSAYASVLGLAATKLKMLQMGISDPLRFINLEHTDTLLKTVLPWQADYIDKYGSQTHNLLLDEVEKLLLLELQNIQAGKETDEENTKRAKEIIKMAEEVNETNTASIQAATSSP